MPLNDNVDFHSTTQDRFSTFVLATSERKKMNMAEEKQTYRKANRSTLWAAFERQNEQREIAVFNCPCSPRDRRRDHVLATRNVALPLVIRLFFPSRSRAARVVA